ncbi:MAG: carbon-nitrogen hydrolase family protein, partial [Bacteroidota bacterium]
MKVCIAQTRSAKGDIAENLHRHIWIIRQALPFQPDLIVFPELSITNYEPELAQVLAISIDDERFNALQELADKNDVYLAVGAPTRTPHGINISLLILRPQQERLIYSKRLLHEDELPYFVSGHQQPTLEIKGKRIALGICYETLQRSRFLSAAETGADLFVASVAKPDRGTDKAYVHFPAMAKEFGLPILMANCVGPCDDFLSTGKSAVWDITGKLISQLNEGNEGLLIYNTSTTKTEALQYNFERAQPAELEKVVSIYQSTKDHLNQNGIEQWTAQYPNP